MKKQNRDSVFCISIAESAPTSSLRDLRMQIVAIQKFYDSKNIAESRYLIQISQNLA
ncbi:hypothetical protein [Helicobacter sp. 23-1045]